MAISQHIERFHDLPVFDFVAAVDAGEPLPAATAVAWKVGLDAWESAAPFTEYWSRFLDTVDVSQVTAVVIGNWSSEEPEPLDGPLAAVTGAAGRLPALRGLFVGDITYEECEISWLEMTDVTGLLTEFPLLEELVVRGGGSGLELTSVRHERLRALRLESGGLPGAVVRAVGACDFPALERLELWLGVDWYGGDATLDDLRPLLDGRRLPALRHLGLENAAFQDEIAAAVAHAPVVPRLERLSLAMGALGDEGVTALLDGQPLTHLKSLDLHHNYLSDELVERLEAVLGKAGVALDLSEREDDGDGEDRYVSVAE